MEAFAHLSQAVLAEALSLYDSEGQQYDRSAYERLRRELVVGVMQGLFPRFEMQLQEARQSQFERCDRELRKLLKSEAVSLEFHLIADRLFREHVESFDRAV